MPQTASIGSFESINDVCTQCGSIITSTTHKHKEHPNPLPPDASPIKKTRKPYKPRKTPAMLRDKSMRVDIKIEMLATVPGVSHAKAEAVVTAYEQSMAQIIGASSTQLARVVCKGTPIGQDLGVAIWRALH